MVTKSQPGLSGLSRTTTVILLMVLLLLVASPLALNSGAGFGGSDNAGGAAVAEIVPGYDPWTRPMWEPPSAEIESMLFALQAAAGGAIIGYILGLRRGIAGRRNQLAGDPRAEDEELETPSGPSRGEACN